MTLAIGYSCLGTGAMASTASDWQCAITSAGTGKSLGGAHMPSAPEQGNGCRGKEEGVNSGKQNVVSDE